MANNRMYLRCKGCGKTFLLAKFYPSTGYYTNVIDEFAEEYVNRLDKYLDKHRGGCSCTEDPENIFEIVYEHADDKKVEITAEEFKRRLNISTKI